MSGVGVPGVVGPNAVLQLAAALREEGGDILAAEVFGAAGQAALLEAPPRAMVDEAVPAALFHLHPRRARAIAAAAGRRTADYVLANRIPAVVRRLLALLPPALSARLLLAAIRRNAWTFAGSGSCDVAVEGRALALEGGRIEMPDAIWHRAVIGRMAARLVDPATRVSKAVCPRSPDRTCLVMRRPGMALGAPCTACRLGS
jgi:divinyl protochlorophyllide a 8-vinyl-reductase